MRCCDCEFRYKCDDTQNVLTAFVKCSRREEFMNSENRKKPATNEDRIRSMSDEELAEWLAYPVCAYAGCEKNCPAIQGNEGMNCNANVLEWLQQPAKEE